MEEIEARNKRWAIYYKFNRFMKRTNFSDFCNGSNGTGSYFLFSNESPDREKILKWFPRNNFVEHASCDYSFDNGNIRIQVSDDFTFVKMLVITHPEDEFNVRNRHEGIIRYFSAITKDNY